MTVYYIIGLALANATISPARIRDLVSFVRDIEQLNEADITALSVLNSLFVDSSSSLRRVISVSYTFNSNKFSAYLLTDR